MPGDIGLEWNRKSIRSLRLRLGWTQADLARRLQCSSYEINEWENGSTVVDGHFRGKLEIIFRQAETCCDEVQNTPRAEVELSKNFLEQIRFSNLKDQIE